MGHVLKINRVSLLILVVFFERSLPLAVQKRGEIFSSLLTTYM